MTYVFLDPFNSPFSGVTSYINAALGILKNNNINALLISKDTSEDLEKFAIRLSKEVAILKGDIIVEAPETLAVSKYIQQNKTTKLHIRLHLSRSIGKAVQHVPFLASELESERTEILRADFVSAPSETIVQMSEFYFNCKREFNIYPNPLIMPSDVKVNTLNQERDIDVIFVGRWQHLKGIDLVKKLVNSYPLLKVCILTPDGEASGLKSRDNLIVDAGSNKNKIKYLSRSKIFILPSIFESVGMVGLEALSCGARVLTTSNCGIVEYSSSDNISICDKRNFKDMYVKITQLINIKASVDFDFLQINSLFLTGLNKLIENRAHFNLLPYKNLHGVTMQKKQSAFLRKFNKLKRDPLGFLRDSSFGRLFFKPAAPKAVTAPAAIEAKDAVKPAKSDLFTAIKHGSKITFSGLNASKHHTSSAFLFPEESVVLKDYLQAQLNLFQDFSPLTSRHLKFGSFCRNDTQFCTPLSIVNRIDVKNKGELGKINNLFLLNANIELCQALKACSPTVNIYNIISDQLLDISVFSIQNVNGLIIVGDRNNDNVGRVLNINFVDDIPLAMRRIVQENVLKNPNMLLTIKGDISFDPEVKTFPSHKYGGKIVLSEPNTNSLRTFTTMISDLDSKIVSIMVTESVYLRYKTLCEEVEITGNAAAFLSASLFDGVLFDIAVCEDAK